MRKVILDLAVTLDGLIEGPRGETDWCIMDEEMDFAEFLHSIDTIFYGRVSYDAWGNYEPPRAESEWMHTLWKEISGKKKYVFSRQAREDDGSTWIHTVSAEKIREIKQQPGKDIWLYGGANLVKTFIAQRLVDIYRLSVHPLVLGEGKPLFQDIHERQALTLLSTRAFQSGVVQLIYKAG